MRATKIKIDNLYGIHHLELDGKPVEITGKKGTGKTSVIDSIKYILSNKSDRPYIVKDGANEGEIYISTDTGIEIKRKKRPETSDYLSVKDNGENISGAQSFLNDIFTPLQLNPVEFASWSDKEQNRAILSLIDFKWDMGLDPRAIRGNTKRYRLFTAYSFSTGGYPVKKRKLLETSRRN